MGITLEQLERHFPRTQRYPRKWANQQKMLEVVAEKDGRVIFESPTGSGKTATEYAIAKAYAEGNPNPVFVITTNKTLVNQIREEFPDVKVALGRSEHECLYFDDKPKADAIPCSMLTQCPHRVDQKTGETFESGACACPYLRQKFEAKQGGVVVCTMSFYLFTMLFSKEFEEPAIVIIDEVHRLADVVRGALSYDISDFHLARAIALLLEMESDQADAVDEFREKLIDVAQRQEKKATSILDRAELETLMESLEKIDTNELKKTVGRAVREGRVDKAEKREALKKLESLMHDLRRYYRSFEYSIDKRPGDRAPLSYTYAFTREDRTDRQLVKYKLVVNSYHVAAVIQKILPERTVSFSATIGNAEILGFETGIKHSFVQVDADFPIGNARIFLPTDTPNLAYDERSKRDLPQAIRKIVRTAKRFADKGLRSLIVVISNEEREKCLMMAAEEGLDLMTYGDGVTARAAAEAFKDGKGQALVGTAANYAEGVDLPKQIAPVIFFLRPGYPNRSDPAVQFEEQRYGRMKWARWNWKVMLQALQVRGRNIRGRNDVGVTFFISQQFKSFLHASLPKALRESYRGELNWNECVAETEMLLAGK